MAGGAKHTVLGGAMYNVLDGAMHTVLGGAMHTVLIGCLLFLNVHLGYQHLIEWMFRLLVVIYVGRAFAMWGGFDMDGHTGGCSYAEVHDPDLSLNVPITKQVNPDCEEVTNPYACMSEEHRYFALEVAENDRHPFTGTGVCSVVPGDIGRFAFESRATTDANNIVCGFDIGGVVPKACNHWKKSLHAQVMDSYVPSLINEDGTLVVQPSYSFSVPGVVDYGADAAAQDKPDDSLFFTPAECWEVVQAMFDLGDDSTAECDATDDQSSLACQLKNYEYDGESTLSTTTKTCCTIYMTNLQGPGLFGNDTHSPTSMPSAAPSAAPSQGVTNAPTPAPPPTNPPTSAATISAATFYDRAGRSVNVFFGAGGYGVPDTGSGEAKCLMPFTGHNAPPPIFLMKEDDNVTVATAIADRTAVETLPDSHYGIVKAYAESCQTRNDDDYKHDKFKTFWTLAVVFIFVEAVFVLGSFAARVFGFESRFYMSSAGYYYITKLVFVLSKTFVFVVLLFVMNQNRNEGCPRYSPSSTDNTDATLIGTFVFCQFVFLYLEGVTRLAWPGTHDADGGNEKSSILRMSLL